MTYVSQSNSVLLITTDLWNLLVFRSLFVIFLVFLFIAGRKVQLYRYADPVLGPRKVPVPNLLSTDRLVAVNDSDLISFEDVTSALNLISKDKGKENAISIGSELLYFVDVQ